MKKKITKKKKDLSKTALDLKRQELFCRYYVSPKPLFANATHSYSEAYGYDLDTLSKEKPVTKKKWVKNKIQEMDELGVVTEREEVVEEAIEWGESDYDRVANVCAVEGCKLLRKPNVIERVRELFRTMVTENVVDSKLAQHILQEDDGQLSLGAIKHYNAVMGRVKTKVELSGLNGEKLFNNDIKAKRKEAIKGYVSRG